MWRQASYLTGGVARRERTHRRAIVLGIGLLIVLSAGPLFGHHLSDGFERVMAGRDHIGALCLIALHLLLEPVHDVFHLLLVLGVAYAAFDRGRAWIAMRRALGSLAWRAPAPGDAFALAAASGGVSPARLRVVEGLPTPALTVGYLRPVIYVAAELPARLSVRQLAAVLAHEDAHATRRDPLRLSLVRFLASVLFWLPAVRRLADDYADDAEIEADDAAARLALPGAPLTLASALVTTASAFGPSSLGGKDAASFCSRRQDDLLGRRVRRLAGEDAPVQSHLSRRSVALAAATLGLVWASSVAVAHPLPAHSASTHCVHESESVLAHLFCRGGHTRDAYCPHRH